MRPVARLTPRSGVHALAWSSAGLLVMTIGYALGWLDRPYALGFFYVGLVGITVPCGALLLAPGRTRAELRTTGVGLGTMLYLGYFVGDEVLAAVGRRLRSAVRSGDLVGRFGGDEFLVLAGGLGPSDDVATLVDRMQQAFAAPVRVTTGNQILLHVSVGVAVQTDPASDAGAPSVERLLALADVDVLRRKRAKSARARRHDDGLPDRGQ